MQDCGWKLRELEMAIDKLKQCEKTADDIEKCDNLEQKINSLAEKHLKCINQQYEVLHFKFRSKVEKEKK